MMKISGVGEQGTQSSPAGISQMTDAVSKNIQSQIMNAQKQLKELSSNDEMTMEEKMEKRKEIQQQIAELNNQLRQHQIEMRKEQRQSKEASSEEMFTKQEEPKQQKATGMSDKSMKAMISADTAISHAKSQGNLKTAMEGRANVLGVEIKLDAARGGSTEAKQEELADLEKRLSNMAGAQNDSLAKASDELGSAVQEDLKEKKGIAGTTDSKDAKKEENNSPSAFFKTIQGKQRAATDYSSVDIHI